MIDVSLNERAVGSIDGSNVTVGDVVQAMGAHIAPGHILTAVEIDGASFSAGDEGRYARRSAATLTRLNLVTKTVDALVRAMHADIDEALGLLEAKLRQILALIASCSDQNAQRRLATLFDELRLVLSLEEHTATLGREPLPAVLGEMSAVAAALLAAQEAKDLRRVAQHLEHGLLPLLQGWRRVREAA